MQRRLCITAIAIALFAAPASAEEPRFSMKAGDTPEVQATYDDIKKTLGIVPEFLKGYPAHSIPGAWQELKNVQLSDKTALSPKVKELIGLAVASQIPCSYCTDFHTQAGKMNGATAEEIKEAIALGACTRHWSTFFSGAEIDLAAFKSDTDKMIQRMQAMSGGEESMPPTEKVYFSTAGEALKDIEATYGFTPEFMKKFPEAGVAGAWSNVKTLLFSRNTAIEPKVKDLISLAVASQVPCEHCIYFDTKAARADGASDAEIGEAVAMGSITRKWSTVLNGLQQDPAAFKKEVATILAHAKAQSKK